VLFVLFWYIVCLGIFGLLLFYVVSIPVQLIASKDRSQNDLLCNDWLLACSMRYNESGGKVCSL